MTDQELARRTRTEVMFMGTDISAVLNQNLISLTYTDNEENATDDLQIKIEDREGDWLTQWLGEAIQATTPANAAKTRPLVRRGSTGQDVADMQAYLVGYGYKLPRFGVDGIFGSETLAAVKAFQADNGLSADGLCGPKTWAALEGTGSAAPDPGFLIRAAIIRENWYGDGKEDKLDCGKFELDAVTAEGPPTAVTIKGTSLPYGTRIRQTRKTKAWESYTLSGIAKEIARTGGMKCMFESSANPFYKRQEQLTESDIAFLSRLCKDAGISLKVTDNIIVLFDQAKYEAQPPIMHIAKDGGNYIKYTLRTGETATKYATCRVRYTVPDTGRVITGIAYAEDYKADKKNNQQLEVTAKVGSAAEAQALAVKRLRLQNKYALTARFTMPGNPALMAGVTVTLSGFGYWSGKYIVSQAKHTVGKGYVTEINVRRVLEGI